VIPWRSSTLAKTTPPTIIVLKATIATPSTRKIVQAAQADRPVATPPSSPRRSIRSRRTQAFGLGGRAPPGRLPGIGPERKPLVSLPRNQFIALVVGVCVLSAAIGSGIALLAQTGPEGPAGKQGKRGPEGKRGPAGESASAEVAPLEAEIEELRGRLDGVQSSAGEGTGELEERLERVEEEVEELGSVASQLCSEVEFLC
jgi:hypothetical protein